MSWSARRRRLLLPLCLSPVLALGSCTKKTEPVTPGGNGGTATEPAAPVELAPVDHPSQLLPRDASILVVGSSVARAAEIFERDRLVETFGPQYTSVRSVITGMLGHDLLDPAEWPAVGLDPNGQVAVGMINVVSASPILIATIGDQVKLTEFVRGVAGKAEIELVETSYGTAKVLRAKGAREAVVMRDQFVAFIPDAGSGQVDLAEIVVTMDPNVSLASNVGYRKSTGGLRAADLSMYFDVLGISQQSDADPLSELLTEGIGGVGFTVTVKRSGPIFDGRIVAEEDAFIRRLLSNQDGAPTLTRAMNGAPLFCLSGRLDAAAAQEFLEAAAEAEGRDFAAVAADTKAEVGLELPGDLPALLAGGAQMCVALEGTLDMAKGEPQKLIGLSAVVGVSDAAKAKYLLAKAANSSGELGTLMKKQGEGYVLRYEDWRDVHVVPQGNQMVISTDAELAKRLASGDPGSMPSKIRPAGARGAINLPGTAVSQAFDLSTGLLWFVAGRASFEGPMVSVPGLTAEELEKVPHSKKSKKARKALKKADTEVEKLELERETAELQQMTAIMDPLGIVVGALIEDDRGFTIVGGQFLRVKSLGQVAEGLIRAAVDGGPQPDEAQRKALDEAWRRRSEAREAYDNARLKDAERHLGKKFGAPAAAPPS